MVAGSADDSLSKTSERLIGILSPHTPFAQAIVGRQAERVGKSLGSLEREDLPDVVPKIEAAARHFVDPPVIEALRREAAA